jgi:hypothetical protein
MIETLAGPARGGGNAAFTVLAGRRSSGDRHGGLKMPKGLLKLMIMGWLGLFFGAMIAGYAMSM